MVLVCGCLGMGRLPCDARDGGWWWCMLIQVQNMLQRSMLCAFKYWSLMSSVSSQCQFFFFSFLVHRKTAHLFEIMFSFHCHLEEKAFANESGELIWSAWY